MTSAVFAAPSGASTRAAPAQGVTADSIVISLIVPDVDALTARGLGSGQSTADFAKRFTAPVSAYGPIRGRKVDVKVIGWDPIDSTSFGKACTKAVIDNKPFVVVNGAGFRGDAVPCITVDNKTPYITSDPMAQSLYKTSGKNLLTLDMPVEVSAKEMVRQIVKQGLIPKTAKIGILSNNNGGTKEGGDVLESELKKKGYNVVSKVELNGLASDASVLQREGTAAANTFQAAGVDTVFQNQSFNALVGFYNEVARLGMTLKQFGINAGSNTCLQGSIVRATAAADGLSCFTTWDGKAVTTKDKVAPDTPFEAQCRKDFEAAFAGKKSVPGSPSGGVTVNGVKYEEDFSPYECTIAKFLLDAIKQAGKNPTWPKVYNNIVNAPKLDAAYLSDGTGAFGPKKPYLAEKAHLTNLTFVGASTPKDANGVTYKGCPLPTSCWVPQLVNGQEWLPINNAASG